jgi:hypothetical protein
MKPCQSFQLIVNRQMLSHHAAWVLRVNSMQKEDLQILLEGEELLKALDIKTLVLDLVKEMPDEQVMGIFWDKLPTLEIETVREYLYMRRQ